MKWYLTVLKKYAVFRGRARRREYWIFGLLNALFLVVLSVIDFAIGTFDSEVGIGVLSGLYSLAVLVPGISVSVRRLHDTGRAGWWVLIWLVPCVGFLVMLVFMALDGTPGDNAYGPNPKQASG